MDKRVVTYIAAGLLAAIGAGLLVLSLQRGDDNEPTATDDSPAAAAEPAAETTVTGDVTTDGEDGEDGEAPDAAAFVAANAKPDFEVPETFVQVSFALNTERAFAGQFRPGDHVGVMASYTEEGVGITDLILQKILVSDVREEAPLPIDEGAIDRLPAAPAGRFFVTLALSADDAESLTHVLEFGQIWLIEQPETASEIAPGIETLYSVLTGEIDIPDKGDDLQDPDGDGADLVGADA